MTSILFRYWRHESQKKLSFGPEDADVWSDLNYRGDGYFVGTPHFPWDDLSTLLTPEHATGILEREKVYINRGEDALEKSDDSTDEYGTSSDQKYAEQPLVLKVYLGMHKPANSSEQKNLSRVRSELILMYIELTNSL